MSCPACIIPVSAGATTPPCVLYLRTDFMYGAPTGGYWVYNGYSSSSESGPFTDIPANPIWIGIDSGDVIPFGDDPQLNYLNRSVGFHSFTYNYVGGSNTLTIQIIDDADCAGEDNTVYDSSSSATPIDLSTYLASAGCPSPAGGGNWENLDGASGWSAPNLTPNVAGAGTFRFRYTLTPTTFDIVDCADCPAFEATITVEITAAFEVNISTASTTCTSTLTIEHPGTGVTDDVAVVMDNTINKSYPVFQFKTRVTNSCGLADIVSSTQTFSYSGVAYLGVSGGTGLTAGGFIEYVTVYSVTAGNFNVPLAPSGANIATFSGSGGTTNATALTFNGVDTTTLRDALKIAFNNYMIDVLGYASEVDYSLKFFTISPISFFPAVYMGIYHSPPASYVGLQRASAAIEYKYDGATPVTGTSIGTIFTNPVVRATYTDGTCLIGAKTLKSETNSISYTTFTNAALMDYDSYPLTTATLSTTVNLGSVNTNLDEDCPYTELTAVPLNCGGVVTYLWTPGGETSNTVYRVTGAGVQQVDADCSSPVASDSDSVTI